MRQERMPNLLGCIDDLNLFELIVHAQLEQLSQMLVVGWRHRGEAVISVNLPTNQPNLVSSL